MKMRSLYVACLTLIPLVAYAGTSQANGGYSVRSLGGTYVFSVPAPWPSGRCRPLWWVSRGTTGPAGATSPRN